MPNRVIGHPRGVDTLQANWAMKMANQTNCEIQTIGRATQRPGRVQYNVHHHCLAPVQTLMAHSVSDFLHQTSTHENFD